MATEILRPNAAGDETELTPSAGANWDAVNDVSPDGDSTYVGTVFGTDLYNLPASSGVGVITSIKVYIRAKTAFYTNSGVTIKTGGTIYNEAVFLTTDYVTYSYEWSANPKVGGAWTWAQIDALQIGVTFANIDMRCTQVYVEIDYTPAVAYERTLSTSIGLSTSLSKVQTLIRSLTTSVGLVTTLGELPKNLDSWLCIASRGGGSVKTRDGTAWSSCAKNADGDLLGAYFAQFDNRLCVIRYQNTGFAYSDVNDVVSNWTDKPNFPNLPYKFTDLFVGRDAGDDPTLRFITPTGVYYLDVFSNFVFGPTEVNWEYDALSGKKGMYWKGDHYIAVGKGIYKVSRGEVTLVGPDMDDGLPEELQGTITDMIGVGFWLVIALDGGSDKKSCILKRYLTGNHWHTVYKGSLDNPIKALFWDSGTLYFGEGSDVKSLPFSNKTENVAQLSTHTYAETGDLIYPYFHSEFEAMPKTAHKVRAVTQDCGSNETITISYRIDEETGWTELGSFETSPRPDALPFPASGDSIGVQFERIQFKATYARATSTNSPKLESLILEYRIVPPVLWGWSFQVQAISSGDQSGEEIISAIKAAIEKGTLMSFFPDGEKEGTEYFVEVSEMPGTEVETEFGQEGVYTLTVQEVID